MTIGRFTTEEEIDYAIATIRENVARLRELSPQGQPQTGDTAFW